MEWQTIETAPKDEWVLVFYIDGEMGGEPSIAMNQGSFWLDWDHDVYGDPSHWMPLPPPPKDTHATK